jgi:hypothetical protein
MTSAPTERLGAGSPSVGERLHKQAQEIAVAKKLREEKARKDRDALLERAEKARIARMNAAARPLA